MDIQNWVLVKILGILYISQLLKLEMELDWLSEKSQMWEKRLTKKYMK